MLPGTDSPLTLAIGDCAREPIHIPGAIQPHGCLLVLADDTLEVLQASENLSRHLAIGAEEALGRPLDGLFQPAFVERVRAARARPDLAQANPLRAVVRRDAKEHDYDAILSRSEGVLLLELEPSGGEETGFLPFYRAVRQGVASLQRAATLDEVCRGAVEEVRRISGFDRVMLYRFDADWNGQVIAEVAAPGMVAYQGLFFPASDIPEQARRLYEKHWIRLIPDRAYRPARLVPALNPRTGRPLDMSGSVLRSVSPVHLEYLKNMGDVAASMSISVLKDDRLWALIACHHPAPRHVSLPVREACEFVGRLLSTQLRAIEIQDARAYQMRLRSSAARVAARLAAGGGFVEKLIEQPGDLLAIAAAGGAAVLYRGKIHLIGQTPSDAEVRELVDRLVPLSPESVFHTDELAHLDSRAAAYAETAAGALAIATTRNRDTALIWFRPERMHTVEWAGDPHKPVSVDPRSGDTRIHPRQSFAQWKETVRLRSQAWLPAEIETVSEFRNMLATEELSRSNRELALSNQELDNFGYIVSHDLKEPVRGIRNYVSFLTQDHAAELSGDSRRRLDQIVTLTKRMDELLDSLFHYSRVGRLELAMEQVDLGDVLQRVTDALSFTLESEKVKLVVPRPLPSVRCDRARVNEVFFNLILNGIKYNERPDKEIEIGWQEKPGAPRAFFVRDNGIGISEQHRTTVFRFFKRLHAREKYGGGTGSGLAIVKRIIELHGGRVWMESTPGAGSVFFFTLEKEESPAPG